MGHDVVTMANAKHGQRWVGWLVDLLATYPGAHPTDSIVYFDPDDQGSMASILDGLRDDLAAGTRSFLVHAQGTRSQSAPDPVTKLSSVFLDLAVETDTPIVPVRFLGGLPPDPIEGKVELPLGPQTYALGPSHFRAGVGRTALCAAPGCGARRDQRSAAALTESPARSNASRDGSGVGGQDGSARC